MEEGALEMSFGASIEHDVIKPWRPGLEKDIGILDEYLHQSSRDMSTGEEVLDEFFECIWELDCKKLLSMIEKHPEWVVEVGLQGRTALHTAVIANSAELVEKLLCIAFKDGNWNPRASQLVDADDKKLQLKAREIALIIGNQKIVGMLTTAVYCLENKRRPFHLDTNSYGNMTQALEVRLQQIRKKLEPIMSTVVTMTWGEGWTLRQVIESSRLWGNEFSLHAVAEYPFVSNRHEVLEEICKALEPGSSGLLSTLLEEVRDEQGRTPLHVLVDEDSESAENGCIRVLMSHCPNLDINSVTDFVGRTPLHWAAALGHELWVEELSKIERIDLNVPFSKTYYLDIDINITAFHLAVVHNHIAVVKRLLIEPECALNHLCEWDFPVIASIANWSLGWSPIQIAAIKGHWQILHELMKDDRLYDCGMRNPLESNKPQYHNGIPALHLAAASGNPLAVKVLLNNWKIDAFALDDCENTALHYAAICHFQEFVHIDHFVSVPHYSQRPTIKKKSVGRLISCMDLLMQAGLDMEQQNYKGATPELGPSSSNDLERWWYEKMAKQTQEVKNNLVAAANAISVTAALVATASFVGPLQPPLGLSTSTEEWLNGYSQVNHTGVEVFLFCDNLSFYLAIASIMLAVIPSLQIPEEGLSLEVSIAGRSVQAAVVLLFASITCVICAFSAASIAIVPGMRWKYKGLIIVSTTVGTLLCFAALCLFSLRLLRLIKPKNKVIKRLNDALSFWIAERSRRASKKDRRRRFIRNHRRRRNVEDEGGSSERNVEDGEQS